MTALTADRQTAYKGSPDIRSLKLADNVKVYKGGYVCTNGSGYAVPGADTSGLVLAGIAAEFVDNTLVGHTAGGKSVRVLSGIEALMSASTLTQAAVGTAVEISDDNTVVAAGAATNHVHGGRCTSFVTASSVWVEIPRSGLGA